MREPHLASVLTRRFDRLVWSTLAAYAVLVVLAFALVSEIGLRRSLEQSADGIESLLGLYVEPGAAPTTVAPAMLADQLLGMGDRFMITRTVPTGDAAGGPSVYFLSPTMPAKRIETGGEIGSTPDDVRRTLLQSIAERGRWRFHVLHRRAGEFDIYVAGSRHPYLLALLGLSLGALLLLPVTALAARRGANRTVARALAPLGRIVEETQAIGPRDLSRRVGVTYRAGGSDRIGRRDQYDDRSGRQFPPSTRGVHRRRKPRAPDPAHAPACAGAVGTRRGSVGGGRRRGTLRDEPRSGPHEPHGRGLAAHRARREPAARDRATAVRLGGGGAGSGGDYGRHGGWLRHHRPCRARRARSGAWRPGPGAPDFAQPGVECRSLHQRRDVSPFALVRDGAMCAVRVIRYRRRNYRRTSANTFSIDSTGSSRREVERMAEPGWASPSRSCWRNSKTATSMSRANPDGGARSALWLPAAALEGR